MNDIRGNEIFPLSVKAIVEGDISLPEALNGNCDLSEDHLAVVYTPFDGFDGVDRCAYRMCDSRGEPFCDNAVVTVFVREETSKPTTPMPTSKPTIASPTHKPTGKPTALPMEIPVAVKDVVDMYVNEVVRVPVLDNDIQGNPNFPLEVIQIVQNEFNALHNALNGVCIVAEDRVHVIYTPNEGFDGVDRCTYEMCDSRGSPCEYFRLNFSSCYSCIRRILTSSNHIAT